jgi:hypothetical protein
MNTILFLFLISLNFFTPENLVTTIVGTTVSFGITQLFKQQSGLQGTGAFILAVICSFGVAVLAVVLSTVMGGGKLSWETIPTAALQIFGLATMAYRAYAAATK